MALVQMFDQICISVAHQSSHTLIRASVAMAMPTGQPEQAAVEATAPVAAGAAAAATTTATQPPSSASPRTSAAGAGGINPVTGAVQRVAEAAQTHEPADQLETHLSPAHKLSNAVVGRNDGSGCCDCKRWW